VKTVGTSLFLARHAQPLVNAGICYGQLDMKADAGATKTCAQALAKILPPHITVVTSPLQRCEQLAQSLLALEPDLTIKKDLRLKEMSFGVWEGQPWADIARGELDAWTEDFAAYPPGGSGESVNTFMARVAAAFDELPRVVDTLWITHAGVIRAVKLIASGQRQLQRADQWPIAAPAYGQWCKLDLSSRT
jgi:alpha-ribazole phosphatase